MATFPFLPKDNTAAPASSTITVKKQPKTFTTDDIADRIAPKFPDKTPQEVREILRAIDNEIIDTLLSGKDIAMPDGSIWSLDADGRTIVIYPSEAALSKLR
ncbi:hypothetical protein VU06_00525 [Desulfobulbus sp. F3]|nr:hypothetical protein [Desulfobulbus sp. F3]